EDVAVRAQPARLARVRGQARADDLRCVGPRTASPPGGVVAVEAHARVEVGGLAAVEPPGPHVDRHGADDELLAHADTVLDARGAQVGDVRAGRVGADPEASAAPAGRVGLRADGAAEAALHL